MLVGIDLGTTFSAIAHVVGGKAEIIPNREGERITPSVVMFEDGSVVVGENAKDNSVSDPEDVCQFVKRRMGDKSFKFQLSRTQSYTAEEISAMILKRLKEDAESAIGEDVKGAVITCPAYFNDAQRKATHDAGEIAGLNVLGIINEPTAAAIAYCYGHPDTPGNVMVFDLGGGTFDITIIKMDENYSNIATVATTGNRNLGGFDFDNLIMKKVMKEFQNQYGIDLDEDLEAEQELRLKAEACKKSLSNLKSAKINIAASGKRLRMEITREEFDQMMKPYLRTMQGYMEDALDEASLKWSDISKVLLVGGSSRIPCVREMIERVSGIAPSQDLNADEAVALGASYYAELLKNKDSGSTKPKLEVVDVNSHSLGIISWDSDKDRDVASFIVKKNTPLPARNANFYGTMVDNQEKWSAKIVEGDDEDPDYDTIIMEVDVRLPRAPKGTTLAIEMSYDTDGIVHTSVYMVHDYKSGYEDEEQLILGTIYLISGDTAVEMFPKYVQKVGSDINVPRQSNLTKEQVDSKRRSMDSMEIE